MSKPKRLALLISGGGTTMAAILKACKRSGPLKGLIEPALIIASKEGIGGLVKAIKAGISSENIVIRDRRIFGWSQEEFGKDLLSLLLAYEIDLFGQYGWLPRTPDNVVQAYEGRAVNQHNAPLDPGRPHFGGDGCFGRRNVCARLYYARKTQSPYDQWTEATTHYVVAEVDAGAVIGRTRVEILPSDDVTSLQERLLGVEHQLQIEVLARLARGTAVPLTREEPLVPEWRVPLLEESKFVAGLLFPNG